MPRENIKNEVILRVCLSVPEKVDSVAAGNPEEQDEANDEDEYDDGFFLGQIGNEGKKMKSWSEAVKVNGVTIF